MGFFEEILTETRRNFASVVRESVCIELDNRIIDHGKQTRVLTGDQKFCSSLDRQSVKSTLKIGTILITVKH